MHADSFSNQSPFLALLLGSVAQSGEPFDGCRNLAAIGKNEVERRIVDAHVDGMWIKLDCQNTHATSPKTKCGVRSPWRESLQFMTSEPFGHSKINRVQPIFCNLVAMFDVNMQRLRSLLAEEEKSESVQKQNGRHRFSLTQHVLHAKRSPVSTSEPLQKTSSPTPASAASPAITVSA
jgi:hypothetical protein